MLGGGAEVEEEKLQARGRLCKRSRKEVRRQSPERLWPPEARVHAVGGQRLLQLAHVEAAV
jgi:hypothetical protein